MKLTKSQLNQLIEEVLSEVLGGTDIMASIRSSQDANKSLMLTQNIINSIRGFKTKDVEKYIEYSRKLSDAKTTEDLEVLAGALEVVTESGEER